MYAVIQTGGKQYRVKTGDVLNVELLDGQSGEEIILNDVLLVADGENVKIGSPRVDGVRVTAEIIEPDELGDKVIAFKFKRRKGYHRKIGVRPHHTVLKIKDIQTS